METQPVELLVSGWVGKVHHLLIIERGMMLVVQVGKFKKARGKEEISRGISGISLMCSIITVLRRCKDRRSQWIYWMIYRSQHMFILWFLLLP